MAWTSVPSFESAPRTQADAPGASNLLATTIDALRRRERDENFPVALPVLAKDLRRDLHAVYAVARTIDDLGDAGGGDRIAALLDFRADLHAIWRGAMPRRAVLQSLVPAVRARGLIAGPFDRLIEANLIDQRVHRYDTFDDLIGYCRLSADPVGHLVLDVFGQRSPTTMILSDRVCRALQLLEHWQDVAEDRRAGRIYLPRADLAAYGVSETDLDANHATAALRDLILFQTERAVRLLESGTEILRLLRGAAKAAVACYIAGGHAAAGALRRRAGEVLHRPPRTRRRDIAVSATALLLRTQLGRTRR